MTFLKRRLHDFFESREVTCSRSVTAPKDALLTCRAYFANAPRRAYGFGGDHDLRRRLSSAAPTCKVISRCSASIVMPSPVLTNARGPPCAASGDTCPTTKPWLPPENRPSVISATSLPRPLPMIAPVGLN